MQLFRLLSLYYPKRQILRGSNVDNDEEQLSLLTSYTDWLISNFKDNRQANSELKHYIHDLLLEEMVIELYQANLNEFDEATRNDNVAYYICGYLVLRFKRGKKHCSCCAQTLDTGIEKLPANFTAHQFTALKNQGNLRFPSSSMYTLLSKVEELITDFRIEGDIFDPNSFIDILYTLCVNKLPKVGCDQHFQSVVTNLIYDYLLLRYRFIAKEFTQEFCETSHTKKHLNSKMSKAI